MSGKGLVIGLAEIGPALWAIEMSANPGELCTHWDLYGEPPPNGNAGDGCWNQWLKLVTPDPPPQVFVEILDGHENLDQTVVQGIAGEGLARVVLDYGTGEISPPLVDLAPISLHGLGFAVVLPGQLTVRAIRGFAPDGTQVLNEIP